MMCKEVNGKLEGFRAEPYDYTNKWVVGVKRFEQAVKAEVDRASRLKSGVLHAATKDYTMVQMDALEGGRYEAHFTARTGAKRSKRRSAPATARCSK